MNRRDRKAQAEETVRALGDGRYVTADDLAATTVDPAVNLHMFSYAGSQASIHRRTIHETAAVVAYVNDHVLD